MKNLKIRVNSADDSKEIQNILESKGFKKWIGWSELDSIGGFIWTDSDMTYCDNKIEYFDESPRKEITLPELRDMVVLKRNDVNDATHESSIYKYFKACDDWYYFDLGCTDKWQKSSGAKPEYYEKLKTIEKKEMKEYLMPSRNYEYILTDAREALEPHAEDWIVIPELSQFAVLNGDDEIAFYDGNGLEKSHFISSAIIWQREQDEPFLTPECTLNDQYAEIEQVRQHKKHERNSSAWDVQVGGDHYKQFQIQPMQFALENKLDAAQQNVIKYIMRHSFKNGKQDLEKAKHYIDLMIEFYYGENNNG